MTSDIEATKKAVREELDKLKQEFKVELPKRIEKARSYGDLRENAEYDAAKERQAFVKARISQLAEQLSQLNNIKLSDIPDDRIAYGSQVTVVDLTTDDRIELSMVSSEEVDPSAGKISLSSPIGAALMNKQVGETAEAEIPAGKRQYYVEKLVTIHGNEYLKEMESE